MSGAARALAAIAAILAISLLRAGPPAPRSADAPPELFSAERALEVLARIRGDQLPHPTGSAENDAVRARLITELEAVGLEAQVQSTLVCTPWATCAELHNVVARIDGSEPGPGLLLLSHYDSQAHAPGADDDGSGVAVWIETARALHGVKPKRTLIFLFSDGEETGLAGAFGWLGDQTDRHLRFRTTSLRGATTVGITTPGYIDLKRIRLNGIDVVPIRKDRMKRAGGLWMARWVTAAPNGVEFELEFESPPEWIEVYDLGNTLPHHDEARRLRAARGSSALPVHGGDSWVVSKQLVLPRAGRSKS